MKKNSKKILVLSLIALLELNSMKENIHAETNNTNQVTNEEDMTNDIEIKQIDTVTATADVNIRNINNEIVGVLPKDKSLVYYGENKKYIVDYYGEVCYISKDYSKLTKTYSISSDIKSIMYATSNKVIKTVTDKEYEVNALECFEIYDENEDNYLVKTNDYIGYITKDNVEPLTGTFVVIDESDQELKLYQDNKVVLDYPVVTGKPDTPTDKGLFSIYSISYNRYLIGPSWKSYVDIMMKFNGGEGLHDAEYHTNENGKKHGWRNTNAFGGNTYLKNGSHGCVNMRHDDAFTVSDYVEVGTKVLVKK